jgi:hypothetical protein
VGKTFKEDLRQVLTSRGHVLSHFITNQNHMNMNNTIAIITLTNITPSIAHCPTLLSPGGEHDLRRHRQSCALDGQPPCIGRAGGGGGESEGGRSEAAARRSIHLPGKERSSRCTRSTRVYFVHMCSMLQQSSTLCGSYFFFFFFFLRPPSPFFCLHHRCCCKSTTQLSLFFFVGGPGGGGHSSLHGAILW